ncbi:signal peptidase II [Patescibacteria group bacterium]|nr:signal peptidase II [Patescibacteria group bacterium]MBU1682398.1 signal peptidase II [Patescibacteria group bacterium]MBU1935428.1 signal peptidase II [Patescibacteria group bacterium]
MKNTIKHHYTIAIISGAILLLLDVITKLWVTYFSYKPIIFIKNFFYLTDFQTNSGIAFGIGLPMMVQIIGSLVVLAILLHVGYQYIFSSKKRQFLKPLLFGIIMGGAVGNLIDRIVQGYVIDFIVLKPIPVFNIADIGVTVGLIGLFLAMLSDSKT